MKFNRGSKYFRFN